MGELVQGRSKYSDEDRRRAVDTYCWWLNDCYLPMTAASVLSQFNFPIFCERLLIYE